MNKLLFLKKANKLFSYEGFRASLCFVGERSWLILFFLKVTGRGESPPPEFHSFNIVADHELQKKLLTRRSKYFSNTGENEGEETQHDAG